MITFFPSNGRLSVCLHKIKWTICFCCGRYCRLTHFVSVSCQSRWENMHVVWWIIFMPERNCVVEIILCSHALLTAFIAFYLECRVFILRMRQRSEYRCLAIWWCHDSCTASDISSNSKTLSILGIGQLKWPTKRFSMQFSQFFPHFGWDRHWIDGKDRHPKRERKKTSKRETSTTAQIIERWWKFSQK